MSEVTWDLEALYADTAAWEADFAQLRSKAEAFAAFKGKLAESPAVLKAAIEASDIVIMTDQPSRIADAMAISRRTLTISRQNIWFALAVKGLVLALSALGMSNMWIAIFSDVGVAVLCILNAMRCLK